METRRLHISGLPADVTIDDLKSRFSSFGTVLDVHLVADRERSEKCRGFGYVSLSCSEQMLRKCWDPLICCSSSHSNATTS
ncbi:hypothetical protein M427DRAFT_63021 [Gonapodya prolifera JEL478]|uniref:RRM domain-containing protein n=1 Tax=Gonapodya prolifera (strain JEL478) TaxID=1344416 RepID=A0A138ZZY8_GONPJ|nr:hypothetical protein M427DRAFT_63021 [Gonapodya prolifera JEL478]|eukprot:KXS10086.1 hypothetical protein M427DRAFT_63021 [Gonapodya prolifera JEL478]